MVTIQDLLVQPSSYMDRQLFMNADSLEESVKSFVSDFNHKLEDISSNNFLTKDERSYHLQQNCAKLSKQFTELNKVFRKMKGMSENSRRHSMYCLSFQKYELEKIAEHTFDWNYFWNKNSKQYNKVKKPAFSYPKFRQIIVIGITFLYVKYDKTIYEFQFIAQMYKTLIEFFDIETVDYSDWSQCYQYVLSIDLREIHAIIDQYKLIKERKYLKKVQKQFPSVEKYRQLQSMGFSQKEIQDGFARIMNCSAKTIQRDMALKGLTFKKFSKTYQPKDIVDKENRLKILMADIEEFYSK